MKPYLAIVKMGLWQLRWFTLWWSLSLALLVVITMVVYPPFRDQAAQLNQAFSQLSGTLKALLAGGSADFLSPIGYLSSKLFYLVLPLLFTIMSIGLGSSLLAREERSGTLELLLARPVSRRTVLLAKITTAGVVMAVCGAVTTAVALPFVKVINFGVSMRYVTLAVFAALLLSMLFGTLAFMLTAIGHSARRASIGVAALVAFGSYLIASLEGTVHLLHWPAKLIPYHYYRPNELLTGNIFWPGLIGVLLATILLAVAAWTGFRKRDLG